MPFWLFQLSQKLPSHNLRYVWHTQDYATVVDPFPHSSRAADFRSDRAFMTPKQASIKGTRRTSRRADCDQSKPPPGATAMLNSGPSPAAWRTGQIAPERSLLAVQKSVRRETGKE